ncbi:MAG: hypothetical protein ACLP78_00890 [Thermoplasmata archaeon]
MSAMAATVSPSLEFEPSTLDAVVEEAGVCSACGHSEGVHEMLLTSTVSWLICHESTDEGECFRARHARGIAFGACRRDPA